jgi:hypothetical protein
MLSTVFLPKGFFDFCGYWIRGIYDIMKVDDCSTCRNIIQG